MSNYTKLIAYDTKDGLTTGDPLKRIKGTELDDEFDAISTAIATKANLASPEFTGTPTVPTATSGNNTTQAASTAFVQAALAVLYPVGSIYTNASNSTNPGTLLGFGTWTAFAAGRVLVGFNSANALFDTAEETGGSADAVTVSHTHTATSTVSDPGHNHSSARNASNTAGNNGGGFAANSYDGNNSGPITTTSASTGISVSTSITSAGSSGTNANYQPFITVYMWKRTA
jgi:hypothetical protein